MSECFIFVARTTAPNEHFRIPCLDIGTFDCTVDWGDGNTSIVTAFDDADLDHIYAVAGDHTIEICGTFTNAQFLFGPGSNNLKVIRVLNFGVVGWLDTHQMFNACVNLESFVAGNTDLSGVTFMEGMFLACSNLTSVDFSNANTTSVTNLGDFFWQCGSLTDVDLTNLDTSNVTNFNRMFSGCASLETLDVTMFDTSSAGTMFSMFGNCLSLTAIDVSGFDTSNVTDMSFMFSFCEALTSLDVSNFVTTSVQHLENMFEDCIGLTALDLTSFSTPALLTCNHMFENIGSINITGVDGFFIENCDDFNSFMSGTTIPTANYDAILVAWAAQDAPNGLDADFGGSTYTAAGAGGTARASLISVDGWSISDGGGV